MYNMDNIKAAVYDNTWLQGNIQYYFNYFNSVLMAVLWLSN